MGCIFREIEVDGARFWALFDSGAVRTYIVRSAAEGLPVRRLRRPFKRGLAGRVYSIAEHCMLDGLVEGYDIPADASVVDRLPDDERGRPVEILVGGVTMRSRGIELDLRRKRLDFTYYPWEAEEACASSGSRLRSSAGPRVACA